MSTTTTDQPNREHYPISTLYLFEEYGSREAHAAKTGQEPPEFNPYLAPKYWRDPAVDLSDPEGEITYNVIRSIKGVWQQTTMTLANSEAAAVNIPPATVTPTKTARPVPCRPLLPNETIRALNPFEGPQVYRLDWPQEDVGVFTNADRTLLQAIAAKIGVTLLLLLVLLTPLRAQTNFAAAGVSYNPGASPAIAGTGLYARQLSESGTYAFSVLDALPVTLKPFQVQTAVGAGIAQRITSLTIGDRSIGLYIPTSAGVSYRGTNTGWAWSTGGLAVVPISSTWRVLPNLRVVKSSVSAGTGYQLIGGVFIGWGW